jgi:hypothetical protein
MSGDAHLEPAAPAAAPAPDTSNTAQISTALRAVRRGAVPPAFSFRFLPWHRSSIVNVWGRPHVYIGPILDPARKSVANYLKSLALPTRPERVFPP